MAEDNLEGNWAFGEMGQLNLCLSECKFSGKIGYVMEFWAHSVAQCSFLAKR